MRRLIPFLPATLVALALIIALSGPPPYAQEGGGKGPVVLEVTGAKRDLY